MAGLWRERNDSDDEAGDLYGCDDGALDTGEDQESRQDDDEIASGDYDEEPETVACPSCGAVVSELAEKCPDCGDWIVPGGDASPRTNWGLVTWLVVGALIAALTYLAVRGGT